VFTLSGSVHPSCCRLAAGSNSCTRQSLAESDDTRGCICTIFVVDLLMIGGIRSKHVEELNNVICINEQEYLCIKLVIIKKLQ